MTDNSAAAPRVVGHPFAPFVRALGRGKTAGRALDEHEAEQAFGMILDGQATDAQTGAFLMLLRFKEETVAEMAGMVRAARSHITAPPHGIPIDLDWPSYAGKRQHHPWYLLSALLLAGSGLRVLMHGCGPHANDRLFAEQALTELGIAPACSWPEAIAHLAKGSFAYLPLRIISPALQQLMDKRAEFGLRSPVNTIIRHIDPGHARTGLRSLHHPAYARLHAETAVALDQSAVGVFRGEGGECEIRPDADTVVSLASGAGQQTLNLSRRLAQRALKPDVARTAPLRTLWDDVAPNGYGLEAVLQTAAVALLCAGAASEPVAAREAANELWKQRGQWPGGTT